MHPSVMTQRQAAAYVRIQAAAEFLAQSIELPDTSVRLADIGHRDPNMRALLKLEAAADLIVRVATDSGYAEQPAGEFHPNEFVLGAEPAASPAAEAPDAGPDQSLARPTGRGANKPGKPGKSK